MIEYKSYVSLICKIRCVFKFLLTYWINYDVEYGMGEKPSTAGDVYSFGVMLLELFTGKRPTHESFIGDLNLVRWVQSAFPANIMQVLDPEMLQLMSSLYHNDQPISPDVQHGCLIIILGVGLSCTVESSDGRISIRSALQNLKSARDTLLNQLPLRMPNWMIFVRTKLVNNEYVCVTFLSTIC